MRHCDDNTTPCTQPQPCRFACHDMRETKIGEVIAQCSTETRRCEWCRELAKGKCGCDAEKEIEKLRACVARAIEMTDEAWPELTYRERAMLKPTLDQWRMALGPNAK